MEFDPVVADTNAYYQELDKEDEYEWEIDQLCSEQGLSREDAEQELEYRMVLEAEAKCERWAEAQQDYIERYTHE